MRYWYTGPLDAVWAIVSAIGRSLLSDSIGGRTAAEKVMKRAIIGANSEMRLAGRFHESCHAVAPIYIVMPKHIMPESEVEAMAIASAMVTVWEKLLKQRQ